jgi:hypothetical protein
MGKECDGSALAELWKVTEIMFGGIELDKVQSVNYRVRLFLPPHSTNYYYRSTCGGLIADGSKPEQI